MSTTNLANLRGPAAPAPKKKTMAEIQTLPKQQQLPALLETLGTEIKRALPAHMNPDRMARIALTCFRSNPTLAECEPLSVFAAILQASQLGLEPGLLGQCYLIPFNKKSGNAWVKECQLIPGYQGLVDLARRSGRLVSLQAQIVHAKDVFECEWGLQPRLVHKPNYNGDRGEWTLVYAVAHLKDGGTHVEVMNKQQVYAIRDRSQNVQNAKKWNKTTPWDTDEEEMVRKTILRRISKYLPKSVELAAALALDDAASRSRSQELHIDDVIEGTWAPVETGEQDDGATGSPAALPAEIAETTLEQPAGGGVDQHADPLPAGAGLADPAINTPAASPQRARRSME